MTDPTISGSRSPFAGATGTLSFLYERKDDAKDEQDYGGANDEKRDLMLRKIVHHVQEMSKIQLALHGVNANCIAFKAYEPAG